MATLYQAMQGLNQGQAVVAGWNNQATLKNITAYVGSDGNNFLPVQDKKDGAGYTPGVIRQLPGGYTFESGYPIVRFRSPTITDGQIDTLVNTLGGGAESFNVTVRYHRYDSVGNTDTFEANAVLNLRLDQLNSLTRKRDTYTGYIWEFVIVETL
jgi:hypothetical protein